MKIKNMMIATFGTVLLLCVGCTSKSVQTTERVPAQQVVDLTPSNKTSIDFLGFEKEALKRIDVQFSYECSTTHDQGLRDKLGSILVGGDPRSKTKLNCGRRSYELGSPLESRSKFEIPPIRPSSTFAEDAEKSVNLDNYSATLQVSIKSAKNTWEQSKYLYLNIPNFFRQPNDIRFKNIVINNLEMFVDNINIVDNINAKSCVIALFNFNNRSKYFKFYSVHEVYSICKDSSGKVGSAVKGYTNYTENFYEGISFTHLFAAANNDSDQLNFNVSIFDGVDYYNNPKVLYTGFVTIDTNNLGTDFKRIDLKKYKEKKTNSKNKNDF